MSGPLLCPSPGLNPPHIGHHPGCGTCIPEEPFGLIAGMLRASRIKRGWVERGDGAKELSSDIFVQAEQVERHDVLKFVVAVESFQGLAVAACGYRRRSGVELAHKLDGVHAHVRVVAQSMCSGR